MPSDSSIGFKWTTGLPENETIYACAGTQVTLPWQYLMSEGEIMQSIEWYRSTSGQAGGHGDLLAMYSGTSFIPMPVLVGRIKVTISLQLYFFWGGGWGRWG